MFKGGTLAKLVPILLVLTLLLTAVVGFLGYRILKLEKSLGTPSAGPAGVANNPAATSPLDDKALEGYAKAIGLNQKTFTKCLTDGKNAQAVKDDIAEGEKLGVTGTPAFFINGRFLGGAMPISAFTEIIEKELTGKGSSNYRDYSKEIQDYYTQGAFNPVPKQTNIGSAPTKGDTSAKVTIFEYSDFECPFCERFYTQTLPQILKDYVDTGKVRFVYKQFPLTTIHPHSQKAAEASLCANEQGKFWEMHDKIFVAMQTPGQ